LSASFALFEQSSLLIAPETQRNDPFRLQTIPGLFSTLKAAMKQDRIETHESPYTHGRQFRNVTTHPRPTHTEECSGGPNVEQIVGGTFWTREKCHGCESFSVGTFLFCFEKVGSTYA